MTPASREPLIFQALSMELLRGASGVRPRQRFAQAKESCSGLPFPNFQLALFEARPMQREGTAACRCGRPSQNGAFDQSAGHSIGIRAHAHLAVKLAKNYGRR